jgi:CRISPR type III-B/RAMP module RAMP protein Cmr1
MKIIEFKIKTITPTLMGGGFGQNDGIRPSEIKGMMRYWFRAVAGSFIRHFPHNDFKEDLKKLKDLEGIIFGDTQKQSSFKILVSSLNLNFDTLAHLPHKNWSKNNPVKVITPNSEFNISILIRRLSFNSIIKLEEYKQFLKNLLKLSFFFGVGFRKNRFFGNMIIVESDFINIKDLINDIKIFISKIFRTFGDIYSFEKPKTLLPLFQTFSYNDKRNGKRNYYINEIAKNCNIDNWEQFLNNFYKNAIHTIERDRNLKFLIDGGVRNNNFHKTSLLNFSYINGSIYLSSFFYKNMGFINRPDKYDIWVNALYQIEKLISGRLCQNGN